MTIRYAVRVGVLLSALGALGACVYAPPPRPRPTAPPVVVEQPPPPPVAHPLWVWHPGRWVWQGRWVWHSGHYAERLAY